MIFNPEKSPLQLQAWTGFMPTNKGLRSPAKTSEPYSLCSGSAR